MHLIVDFVPTGMSTLDIKDPSVYTVATTALRDLGKSI